MGIARVFSRRSDGEGAAGSARERRRAAVSASGPERLGLLWAACACAHLWTAGKLCDEDIIVIFPFLGSSRRSSVFSDRITLAWSTAEGTGLCESEFQGYLN